MTDEQILALAAMREWQKQALKDTETLLKKTLREWGRERGFLIALTAEQAMREMRRSS